MAAQQTLYFILSAILILAGLVGTAVPALPGVPLVFGGMWLAAWADHFRHVGSVTLIVLGLLSLIAMAIDACASLLGAKRVGASSRAIWGALIGTFVGIFFGLPGIVFGPFAGAIVGELLVGSDLRKAAHVGLGTWLGLLFGTLTKIALCFTMLGVFVLAFVL